MPKQVGVNTNPSRGAGGTVGPRPLPPAPSPSPPSGTSAHVTGAGTSAANGTYTLRGIAPDPSFRAYYNLIGQPDDPAFFSIVWNGARSDAWGITNDVGEALYDNNGQDVAFPWLSSSWAEVNGDSPPPTVTQGPP